MAAISVVCCLHRHADDGPTTISALGKKANVPNLKNKHPLNMAAAEWIEVLATAHRGSAHGRRRGVDLRAPAPIALTETKNETSVPDDAAKQAADRSA